MPSGTSRNRFERLRLVRAAPERKMRDARPYFALINEYLGTASAMLALRHEGARLGDPEATKDLKALVAET